MNFIDCMIQAAEDKKITRKQLERIQDKRKLLTRRFKDLYGADADAKSVDFLMNAEINRLAEKNANRKGTVTAVHAIRNEVKANTAARLKEWDKALENRPALRKVTKSKLGGWMFLKPTESREVGNMLMRIDNLANARNTAAHKEIIDLLDMYDIDILGRLTDESKAKMEAAIRASTGDVVDGDPKAVAAGAQLRKMLEKLADEYRAAGGIMGKVDNWLPQIHDSAKLRNVGYDDWKAGIVNKLDWDRIVDDEGIFIASVKDIEEGNTGRMDQFLREVYETLSTDGANKLAAKAEKGGSVIQGGWVISLS